MKKIIYLTAALGIILLGGCDKKPVDGYSFYSDSYIQFYVFAETLSSVLLDVYSEDDIAIAFFGKELYYESKADAKAFKTVCNHFGDTTYKRRSIPPSRMAIATEFISADVVCHQNFDADHPAGTSLGDIVKLLYVSHYPYIQSGCKSEELKDLHVEKLFIDLTEDDLKLLDNDLLCLRFPKHPSSPGSYTFTVTFSSAGETVAGNIKMVFE